MSLFNFRLKHPDHVVPWGEDADRRMHWFGLTDGEYWVETPQATLFEYTSEILKEFEDRPQNRFVDYHITRFVEDMVDALPTVHVPVPDHLFGLINTHDKLQIYLQRIDDWVNGKPDDAEETDEELQNYEVLTGLEGFRCINSAYLINGPYIWLIRNKERIAIVWQAEGVSEKGTRYWTASSGELEMSYDAFLREVRSFVKSFFDAMEQQVITSIAKDWGNVELDKQDLAREQAERRLECERILESLNKPAPFTDWSATERAIRELL